MRDSHCGAATIWMGSFLSGRPASSGQTSTLQIDGLAGVGEAFSEALGTGQRTESAGLVLIDQTAAFPSHSFRLLAAVARIETTPMGKGHAGHGQ